MKRWIILAITALILIPVTACDKVGLNNPPTSQSTANSSAPTPQAAIDAAPQPSAQPNAHIAYHRGNCGIDIFPENVGLVAGAGLVLSQVHSWCRGATPYDQTIAMVIQSCAATVCSEDSDWHTERVSKYVDSRIPPQWPSFLLLHTDADCVPGVYYRLGIRIVGHDAMTLEGNPRPIQGPPFSIPMGGVAMDAYVYGQSVTYSQSSCWGK